MSTQEFKSHYLTGKVAYITGAGSGIGRETAIHFARKGAKVALVGRNEDNLKETAKLIAELSPAPETLVLGNINVSSEKDVIASLKEVEEKWGRLDMAFNNAGIAPDPKMIVDTDFADFHKCMQVNVAGVYNCMKHQIPMMKKAGGGYIVNNSSVAGLIGFQGAAIYCASKHAVMGLTRATAFEVAKDNIFINAICPGPVQTELLEEFAPTQEIQKHIAATTAVGRFGKTSDIARMVVKMCDPDITFMIGSAVTIDGGQSAGF